MMWFGLVMLLCFCLCFWMVVFSFLWLVCVVVDDWGCGWFFVGGYRLDGVVEYIV